MTLKADTYAGRGTAASAVALPEHQQHLTANTAGQLNEVLVSLAAQVPLGHANSDSKTEVLVHELAVAGKPLLTPDSSASKNPGGFGGECYQLAIPILPVALVDD